MTRHLPDVPWWREGAARTWTAVRRPRRMSRGASLAVIVLVLLGIGISAYTRHYVDMRVKIRAAQNCASWGADQALFNLVLSFPTPPRSQSPQDIQAAQDFHASLVQARDTKIELRRMNECPPYPPPPTVPPLPSNHP